MYLDVLRRYGTYGKLVDLSRNTYVSRYLDIQLFFVFSTKVDFRVIVCRHWFLIEVVKSEEHQRTSGFCSMEVGCQAGFRRLLHHERVSHRFSLSKLYP
jgi:hypothetical protein